MKSIIALLVLIIINSACQVGAQQLPELVANRIAFCNANLDESLIPKLKIEFQELEDYYIKEGLLRDNSGLSYLAVFEQIAEEGNLKITTDLETKTIEEADFSVLRTCSFKLLSDDEMGELTPRHLELSIQVNDELGNDASLDDIALSITKNMTATDFDLKYYKLSSLLSFYVLSKSPVIDLTSEPTIDLNTIKDRLFIELNAQNEVSVSGKVSSMNELKSLILIFLSKDIETKALEITAEKSALYESYIKLLDLLNECYLDLRNQRSQEVFGKPMSELSKEELTIIMQRVPKNIIINKPN